MIELIKTNRLILRPIIETDYEDICEYGSDEETGKYMLHWPKTNEQIKEFIIKCKTAMNLQNPNWYEFVLQMKSTSKVIGNISLIIKNNTAEIGWLSNKKFWNYGYMSEAVKAMIDYAFQNIAVDKIIATCTEKNIASYRIMEKCGMTKIGEDFQKSIKDGKEVFYTKLTYCINR